MGRTTPRHADRPREASRTCAGDHRAEAFAAWRRFFEAIADQRPLVLVFEDLHWADEGLLDFVDHLVDWAGGVPILVVCTARPELLSRRPGWGGGKPNALTLSLSPLDDDQTARLLAALLERSVLPAETQTALLQRAGGNPLYAEEFVRMVTDRELVAGDGRAPAARVRAGNRRRTPRRAARRREDASPGRLRARQGVLARAPRRRSEVSTGRRPRLRCTARTEGVRASRASRLGRGTRASTHSGTCSCATSRTGRSRAPDGRRSIGSPANGSSGSGVTEDHAEMLAHHYSSALELARAAGARHRLARAAGLAALKKQVTAHTRSAPSRRPGVLRRRARGSGPRTSRRRPSFLIRYGRVLNSLGWAATPSCSSRQSRPRRSRRRRGAAAEAEALLCEMFWLMGQRDAAFEHLRLAEALVEDEPNSYSKAYVWRTSSRFRMLAGDSEDAIRVGLQALAMAEELGLDELQAHALDNIGDQPHRVRRRRTGSTTSSTASRSRTRSTRSRASGPTATSRRHSRTSASSSAASRCSREARRLAERFGVDDWLRWLRGESSYGALLLGRLGRSGRAARRVDRRVRGASVLDGDPVPPAPGHACAWPAATTTGRRDDAERALELAREAKDPQVAVALARLRRPPCGAPDPERAGASYRAPGRVEGSGRGPARARLTGCRMLAFVLPVARGRGAVPRAARRVRCVNSPWRKAALAYRVR